MNKPGIQTSEFWLTASALSASVCHALGYTGGVSGDVQTTIGGAALAIITAWFGSNYMGSRLQLKSEDRLQALERLRDAQASGGQESDGVRIEQISK